MNDTLPTLGVGLGLRTEFAAQVSLYRDRIDFLEIVAEHFLTPTREAARMLASLSNVFPLVPHSIGLSLGSAASPDPDYVRKLARLVRETDAPWFSDHICYTRAGGVDVGHLAPLPRSEEALSVLVRNATAVRETVGAPMLLENIAYVVDPPGAALDEAAFVTRAVVESGCGLLLDLTNLHANALNHGYDPRAWLDRIPLERVVQVHVTGGHWRDGVLVDSHSTRTPDDVWDLLEYVASRAPVRAVLLERDERIPPIADLLDELDLAREALARAREALAAGTVRREA